MRKSAHSHQQEHTQNDINDTTSNQRNTSASYNRMKSALESLRYQHAALVKLIPVYPSIDTNAPTAHNSPLPTTREEDDGAQTPTTNYPAGAAIKRMSAISSTSDGSGIWFDAPDGAEEFVLEATPDDEISEQKALDSATHSTVPSDTYSTADTESSSGDNSRVASPEVSSSEIGHAQVQRRTQLPSPVVGDEGSLFAVLKKNVGKVLLSRACVTMTLTNRKCRTSLKSPCRYPSTSL